MKKYQNKFIGQVAAIFIAVACSFLFCLPNLSAQQNYPSQLSGFRDFAWGSSIENVRQNEDASFIQSFDGFGKYVLTFRGRYFGSDVLIHYTFIEDSLSQGSYVINSDEDIFIEDFSALRQKLSEIYGRPRFRAGPDFRSDSLWIPVTIYETYRGPQLFWKLDNGFVGMISERDEDEVAITLLFVGNSNIEEYLNERSADVSEFDPEFTE